MVHAGEKYQMTHDLACFTSVYVMYYDVRNMWEACLVHTLTVLTCSLVIDFSYVSTRADPARLNFSYVPSSSASYYKDVVNRARQFCLKVHRTSVTHDVTRRRRTNTRPRGRGKVGG